MDWLFVHVCDGRSKVAGGTELHIDMISQLKEAVELLQDPNRWLQVLHQTSGKSTCLYTRTKNTFGF